MKQKKEQSKIKNYWKKFWFLLWKDDSPKGWIFSIIFLFIFIKFIFFPGLSLVTGTSLPLAIVESCSMYHEGNLLSNYDDWWETHKTKYSEIEQNEFKNFKFKNGFNKGDILFIIGTKPEKLKIGDTIIFSSGTKQTPIIHRIIKIKKTNQEYIFSTIGDNNQRSFSIDMSTYENPSRIDEINIKENQIIGKAVFKLAPYAGWGKLIFFEFKQPESNKGFCEGN